MTNDLKSFIVYAPYRTETEAVERRKSFRNEHAAGMAKLKESGTLQQVIMHLKPPLPNSGEEVTEISSDPREQIIAATLIIKVGTYLEVKNIILSDIYWTEDVWNKEQLVINPALIL